MRSRIIERAIRLIRRCSPWSSKSPSRAQHPTRAFTQRPSIVVAGVTTILSTIRPKSSRSDQSMLRPCSIARSSLAATASNCRPRPRSSKSAASAPVGPRRESSPAEKRAERREILVIYCPRRKIRGLEVAFRSVIVVHAWRADDAARKATYSRATQSPQLFTVFVGLRLLPSISVVFVLSPSVADYFPQSFHRAPQKGTRLKLEGKSLRRQHV